MDRRTLLKTMAAGGAAASLTGCVEVQNDSGTTTTSTGAGDGTQASSNVQPGKVTAWVAEPPATLEIEKDVLDGWDADSPHSVELSDIADLAKKTQSAIPAGQGPTTFQYAHDWVGKYYEAGFLADQSQSLDVDLDTFTSAAREAVKYDGATLGLPTYAETVGLIYNKDMVDEPPKTVAEMTSIMEEHHDPQNGTYGLSYALNSYFCSAWARAFGGYYFDPEKESTLGLTDPQTVEGFQFVLDNFLPYMSKDTTYGPQMSIFAQGNAPFAFNGPWYLSTLDQKGVDYGVTELPTPDGGTPSPYTGVKLWYFCKAMTADEQNAAATRAFTEWYTTNTDLHLRLAKELGHVPVLKELAGSEELPADVRGFSNAVAQGVPMPVAPKMQEVFPVLDNAISKVATSDTSVTNAMQQAEETIRKNWQN